MRAKAGKLRPSYLSMTVLRNVTILVEEGIIKLGADLLKYVVLSGNTSTYDYRVKECRFSSCKDLEFLMNFKFYI